MCGITGFIDLKNKWASPEHLLERMAGRLTHRGPDNVGIKFDKEKRLGLAHTRLSIIDLSSAGHQPMVSANGRYDLIFNGEIYNHLDIRKNVENKNKSIKWMGRSDTESILQSFELFGILETIKNCIGQFSIVVFDRKSDCLHLIVDRMGEKPLYYGTHENNFIFSSELKSFYELPNYSPELNLYSIKEFFNNSYIPAPKTIFNDIFKLSASSYLKINIHEDIYNIKPDLYWSAGTKNTFSEKSYNKNPNELDHLINDSVKQQMVADVPIGVFLSGGIDSSLIASYAKKTQQKTLKLFQLVFLETSIMNYLMLKKLLNI